MANLTNKIPFSFISKDIEKNIIAACEKVDLKKCLCGGDGQFLLASHNKLESLVRCVECKKQTRFHNKPQESGAIWNVSQVVNSKKRIPFVFSGKVASISLIKLTKKYIYNLKLNNCGCKGEVNLYIEYHLKPYSICKCESCGTETELKETAIESIAAWNLI
jgi:hypothetical protein